MKLAFAPAALRKLRRMQPAKAKAIRGRLEAIAARPFARHANVKPMNGLKNVYRLRVGDWRVVYEIDRQAQEMRVVVIEIRGDIYG